MVAPATRLANELVSHLNGLDQTRRKVESLFGTGALVRRDIQQVYAGLYLDAVTSFEDLIEKLFIGLLVGNVTSSHAGVVPRVTFKSPIIAREIVFGGRNYVDWLPFDQTEKRAKAFFRNGMPFTSLVKQDRGQIDKLIAVRNAIAHRSAHSQRQFEQRAIGSTPVTPKERIPAGYLRSRFRVSPDQTQYESLVGDMATVAQKLCM